MFAPALADALRRVTEYLPYCDHVVATTYLAGISGLVKLGTGICRNPYTDFVTQANLYVATVGHSGQKKTPLEKLLVRLAGVGADPGYGGGEQPSDGELAGVVQGVQT